MGRDRQDITGKRFGRLVVSSYIGTGLYECECDCGNIVRVFGGNLVNGATKSCGCLRREITHSTKFKHGEVKEPLYIRWKQMRRRCQDKNCKDYPDYGGRGIAICNEWNDYITFRDWAQSNGYNEELSIDRVDVNGPYSPDNCRWATASEQARNKRNTVWLTINGTTRSLLEWSEISGLNRATIRWRMLHGVADDELLASPYHNKRRRRR